MRPTMRRDAALLPASLEFRQRGYNILVLVKEEPAVTTVDKPFLVSGRVVDINQ